VTEEHQNKDYSIPVSGLMQTVKQEPATWLCCINLYFDGCISTSLSLHLSVSQASSKALEQETRERATVLQTEFENFVHLDAESVQNAKRGM